MGLAVDLPSVSAVFAEVIGKVVAGEVVVAEVAAATRAASATFVRAAEAPVEARPVPAPSTPAAEAPIAAPSATASLPADSPPRSEETTAGRSANAAVSTDGHDAVGDTLTPLPAKGNVAAVARFLLRIVTLPEVTSLEVGRNETCSTVRSFGASDTPADTFENAKPAPITVTPEIVTGVSPAFSTVIFFVLTELSSCEPKFKDDGESCNAANTSLPVPVNVYDCMASALLTSSSSAEVFPADVGSKIIWKSMLSKGATEAGTDGPAT
jgi:hypothetical protein